MGLPAEAEVARGELFQFRPAVDVEQVMLRSDELGQLRQGNTALGGQDEPLPPERRSEIGAEQ